MQFTTAILAALTILGASAIPMGSNNDGCPSGSPTTSSPSSSSSSGTSDASYSATCPSTDTEYCCDSSALVDLTCVLSSVLGNSCTQQTICCVNNGGTQDCSETDGTAITIPVNIDLSDISVLSL